MGKQGSSVRIRAGPVGSGPGARSGKNIRTGVRQHQEPVQQHHRASPTRKATLSPGVGVARYQGSRKSAARPR